MASSRTLPLTKGRKKSRREWRIIVYLRPYTYNSVFNVSKSNGRRELLNYRTIMLHTRDGFGSSYDELYREQYTAPRHHHQSGVPFEGIPIIINTPYTMCIYIIWKRLLFGYNWKRAGKNPKKSLSPTPFFLSVLDYIVRIGRPRNSIVIIRALVALYSRINTLEV